MLFRKSKFFKKTATLRGSQDGINALAFSEEGKFLAAAGRGGAIIWDLATLSEVTTPSALIQSKTWDAARSFNTVEWMYFREQESTHILLLGSDAGEVILLGWVPERKAFRIIQRLPPEEAGDGVISMHVYEREPSQARAYFVVATYGGRVSVRRLTLTGCHILFSTTVDYELVAVRFYPRTRDVYLFAAAGGLIACLDKETGQTIFSGRLGPETMGSICVDSTGDRFVVGTARNFEMFNFKDVGYLQTFVCRKPIVPFPKDAAFTDDGLALVGGTDYGVAAVFDVNSGAMVQTLNYPEGGLVQTVAVYTSSDTHTIAIAGSTLNRPAEVILFQKSRPSNPLPPTNSYYKIVGPQSWWLSCLILIPLALIGCHTLASIVFPQVRIHHFAL
ncbi:quinon protein alcohol dehydrogenase-like superfamily [Lentinula guzmanii]|uniref:Quinon protein alcohol dehydrogenase-like superfamily n=2 Tax=Lentinula TaxID=5352 RepID=A0AA38JVC5_9AGAR|nr:quinon protein alcohol dehydrogenase-like superfamily [Lentinula guzmanii]KAJ3736236.1 quinon protein alcohol dehydrogenase-like superfamily [Lentinula guzmanii]KAJ3780654.1 quinon protein alcohol dehydrogenase-like superfamily [Lentinula aff. detonsa]